MGLAIRTLTEFTDIYVLFRGTSIAVPTVPGTGLDAGWYTVSDDVLQTAELPAGVYDGAFLHGDYTAPSADDSIEGIFGEFSWTGTVQGQVSDQQPDDDHTWRFEAPDALTAANTLYETVGFNGPLAMRMHENILDQNSIQSVAVAVYPTSGLSLSAQIDLSKHVIVIPAVATVARDYIVVATITKIDGQVILRRGIAVIQTASGT